MSRTNAALLDAAKRAATSWVSDVGKVELLAISENAVYRVESVEGDRFVLRLHRAGYNSLPEMLSEVQWVNDLIVAGVPVSTPRRALDGEWYVPVDVEGTTRLAGAVEWVSGTAMAAMLESPDREPERHYSNLGMALAQLRGQSQRFVIPEGFSRRHWDSDGFVGDHPLWGRFWESSAAAAPQREVLLRARDHLRLLLADLSKERDRYGLIHADLHPDNVMVDGADMTLIDFDDAGFGWYIHELAVALHSTRLSPEFDDARAALVRGYRTVHDLAAEELDLLDSFLLVRSLMLVGWLEARPEVSKHRRLTTAIAEAVDHAESIIG